MIQRTGFNLRKYPRVKLEVPVDVELLTVGAESMAQGITINLSEGGMAFEYPRGLVEGDELTIKLGLPGLGGEVEMPALVVHCLWPEEAGKMAEIRVRFIEPDREIKKLLRKWVTSKLPAENTLHVAEMVSDRRKEERYSAEIEVSYHELKGLDDEQVRSDKTQIPIDTLNRSKYFKNVGTVFSDNLSPRGIRLKSEEELPRAGMLSMTFKLPGLPMDLHAIGRVVWAKEEMDLYWAGVEFITLDKDDAIRIEKHVFDVKRSEGAS